MGTKRQRAAAQEESNPQLPAPSLSEATHEQATDIGSGRITRSSRANRERQNEESEQKEQNDSAETSQSPSMIITLKAEALIGNTIGQQPSQGRAPASSTAEPDAASRNTETPHKLKRVRRTWVFDDPPMTTRSAARKANYPSSEQGDLDSPISSSQVATSPRQDTSAEQKASADNDSLRPSVKREHEHETSDDQPLNKRVKASLPQASTENSSPQQSEETKHTTSDPPNPPQDWAKAIPDERQDQPDGPHLVSSTHSGQNTANSQDSTSGSRRRSLRLETGKNSEKNQNEIKSSERDPKVEDNEVDRALQQQLQNHVEELIPGNLNNEADTPDGSVHVTEDYETSNLDEEGASVPKARGRGQGRGNGVRRRGRGGRYKGNNRSSQQSRGRTGRSRGGRRGRPNLRSQRTNSSDPEYQRSPSPGIHIRTLRDRQRELAQAFRKVAAVQRFALNVIATHTERSLARDKNAHMNVPEYDKVQVGLKEALDRRQNILRREYELRVEQANRLFEAETERIQQQFKTNARQIQDEHLLAAQGQYMEFIEGQRAAEDEEHTEPENTDSEIPRGIYAHLRKEFARGFNSSSVRELVGAAAYDRAESGWDNFVQRAKLREDISPQMKEIIRQGGGPFAGLQTQEVFSMLLEAAENPEQLQGEQEAVPQVLTPGSGTRPDALSALADAALSESRRASFPPIIGTPAVHEPITTANATHRTVFPQPAPLSVAHGPTEPCSFMLPPVIAHPRPVAPPRPRPLLPASQKIPSLSEHLSLPDPFGPRGSHLLPPPPGSNLQPPPPPGYLQMPGHQPYFFAPYPHQLHQPQYPPLPPPPPFHPSAHPLPYPHFNPPHILPNPYHLPGLPPPLPSPRHAPFP